MLIHSVNAGNQVTPFELTTSDGETLHAWHILPLPLYAKHEESVSSSREPGLCKDVMKTESFRLLKEDPNAKVIVFCKSAHFVPTAVSEANFTSPRRELSARDLVKHCKRQLTRTERRAYRPGMANGYLPCLHRHDFVPCARHRLPGLRALHGHSL